MTVLNLPALKINCGDVASTVMPPKKELEIQAVVLCDSYKARFYPLTKEIPRCLLPVGNKPLLDYTLEFLQSAKVTEVFLLCSAHSDQVTKYIENSKWSSPYVPFHLQTIELPNTLSLGDAMREVDSRGIIRSDFLLISGDVVSNLDFETLWAAHQERKKKDKDCIMSITLREATATHRTRSPNVGIYVLQGDNLRVIGYKPSEGAKSMSIEASEVLKHPSCYVRNDLIDCFIDICTPDVPALFTENFDYETLRRDFVTGIVTSELLGKNIYANLVNQGYAARAENFRTYEAIARDLIAQYALPVNVGYHFNKGNVYKGSEIQLSQSCHIGHNTIIGDRTCVGANSRVSSCTIGKDCTIGDNVTIVNSFIWDNVRICDGSVITNSIIANNAVIGANAKAEHSIISFNQEVEKGAVLSDQALAPEYAEDSDDSEDEPVGFLADEIDYLHLSDDSISSVKRPYELTANRRHRKSRTLSTSSALTADDDEDDEFFREAVASINRSIVDNHEQDVAIIELNTLRMTMNASHDRLRDAVVHSLLTHIAHLIAQGDVKTASETVWTRWSPLLKRITFDSEAEVQLANAIEAECAKMNQGDKLLFFAISTLYDTDVLKEDSVYKWWDCPSLSVKNRTLVGKWVEWLQNAESESESE